MLGARPVQRAFQIVYGVAHPGGIHRVPERGERVVVAHPLRRADLIPHDEPQGEHRRSDLAKAPREVGGRGRRRRAR